MGKHRPRPRSVRRSTVAALAGGALVVLPTVAASGLPVPLAGPTPAADAKQQVALPWLPPNLVLPPLAVDGSLPQPPTPQPLTVPGFVPGIGSATPSGPLGIPASMLKAYKNAADIMAREQPGCHLDWALIAAIGRVESNHARGGFVDAEGNTLEPILGPVLDGSGSFAAIPDTDGGKYDGDPLWDRAVGATQFIPGTWRGYASDGNGDGVSDPDNIYDETLATARYLCSGGLDLSTDQMQRVAVRRYNNSQSYVDTVMAYAAAYRGGVSSLPDSQVPIGAPPGPGAVAAAAGSPLGDVAPPAAPIVTPPGSPTQLPLSSTAPGSSAGSPPTTPTSPGETSTTTTLPPSSSTSSSDTSTPPQGSSTPTPPTTPTTPTPTTSTTTPANSSNTGTDSSSTTTSSSTATTSTTPTS
ncbi:lytic transglycosylase domain-containing protein [Amycolatopsis sp. FDAARGOS 1241]|uniref:lytic transglycosylase domain-containing protein n=1 Tax=Amycolatopsis sp. FDAARGOS 1241 TaxID=2778070 RepID=UPI0019521CA8|nr:lytic murein transglycosylase [Amycolatopsis sp. FDAARGOS 1241]QRP47567.1 lytic murein transglycosylase [Amycolatopsis sp. FDAARGOS 1241]